MKVLGSIPLSNFRSVFELSFGPFHSMLCFSGSPLKRSLGYSPICT
jgi:hypothetical protein